MKLNIYLFLLFAAFSFASCFEDDSNEDFVMKTPIVIDLNDEPASYVVKQFGRLRIAPLVYREGLPDADLSFKWELRGKDLSKVIGDRMVLDTIITEPKTEGNYTVLLTVTDNTTKISSFQTWELTVEGVFASGIIVADTRDNGMTSDLNLLMGYNFSNTYDYSHDADVLISGICGAQGAPIDGKVLTVQNWNDGIQRLVTVTTDKGIMRYNADTYQLQDENGQLFLIQPETSGFYAGSIGLNKTNRIEVMVMDGKIYTRSCAQNNKLWGYGLVPGGSVPEYNCSTMVVLNGIWGNLLGYAFDDINHRFLQIRRNDDLRPLSDGTAPFNPNNVGTKECIYMGQGMDNITYAVMKDETNPKEKFEIYGLRGQDDYGNNSIQSGRFNISNAKEIDKALFWQPAFYESELMFYATSTTVYSLAFRFGSNHARYTVPEGEVITSMRMWSDEQGNVRSMPWWAGGEIMFSPNYGGDMMVLTTWNEAEQEGRIRCLPFTYMDGEMQPEVGEEYRGFGRILAWGSQKD